MDTSTSSPPTDPIVMAQQIQALTANVQELMKQNEELKRRARPRTLTMSQSWCNSNDNYDDAYSSENSRRDTFEHTAQSTQGSDQMMKNMRKELDEVKNAMKGKTTMNLDDMIKRTDSPVIVSVLECPLPPKFHLPQLEVYDGTKNPLDHIGAFKTILSLQQTQMKLFAGHSQQPLGKQHGFGAVNCQQCPLQTLTT